MKKLLLLITGLLLLLSVEGQILRYGNYVAPVLPEEESEEPPSFLTSDGYTDAWYIWNEGITQDANGISQWNDLSSNALHLTQNENINKPTVTTDGILFDGNTDSKYIGNTSYSRNAPYMFYLVVKFTDVVNGDVLRFSYPTLVHFKQMANGPDSYSFLESDESLIYHGTIPLNEFVIIRGVINGSSSSLQCNTQDISTGTLTAVSANRIQIFGGWDNPTAVTVAELIVRHSTVGESDIYNYLNTKY